MNDDFSRRLAAHGDAVRLYLDSLLSPTGEPQRPARLTEAMRHGVLNGGKRLRPFLLMESAALFGVAREDALPVACALECVHCYSLIHDDLPAMDDDDLRRGQPTVHRAYDEATAILAGDALLTLAFELLADPASHSQAAVRIQLASMLAKASGGGGMIGGQMLDIAAETAAPDEAQVRLLQSMKTGALIRFACEAGAVLGEADEGARQALVSYGEKTGLAFQLADDLLDVTSNSVAMGKATGKDEKQGKGTLVGILGLEPARALLEETVADAIAELEVFGEAAEILRQASRFVADRKS